MQTSTINSDLDPKVGSNSETKPTVANKDTIKISTDSKPSKKFKMNPKLIIGLFAVFILVIAGLHQLSLG